MSSSAPEENVPKKEHVSIFTGNVIDTTELVSLLNSGCNHGLCGGYNLGNTCFMNSSIACLSNCYELTSYFLTKEFEKDINTKNKEGLGGKLAYAWYNLLRQYWMSNIRIGNPSDVKAAVSKKVRKFSGFNQQDSNEFMTEFLSLLSEDLNRNNNKTYKAIKEKQENESEFECASRFWKVHLQRNDSVITDLFSGLLKSEVICSVCGFNNTTFDPFNTLNLAIPNGRKFFNKINKSFDDIQFFYIPKYCIKSNKRICMRVKKNCPLKEVQEELNKSGAFDIEKLKFIQVLDGKLVRFIDDNEFKREDDFVFAFNDESNEGENNKIIPLYMKKGKTSAFPRLLFLKENMNFGELKRKIYYFARNFFKTPFKKDNEEKNELDDEIQKYRESKPGEPYDDKKLFELFNKEYNEIFSNTEEETKKKEVEKFLSDFPYNIIIKKKFDDNDDGMIIFDGKNNDENLKEFNISKDEDSISTLLEKIDSNKDYYLFLILKQDTQFYIPNMKLDSCENYQGQDYGKKETLTLNILLDYFCSDENIGKGNEWYCNKCKKRVPFTKKLSIYYVPRILIICLKRFSRQDIYYEKNGELIDFPLDNLDMGKYVCGPDKPFSKYDLFAVSQHFGGTGGGHYTAVCKNIDGKWYDYNDSTCSSTSASNIVTSSAYVLFYRKRCW